MFVVGHLDPVDEQGFPPRPAAHLRQEPEVPGQGAARDGAAGSQVGFGPNAGLALQPPLHFLGVGADLLTQGGELVHEGHRRGQEGVDGVLGHLRRLDGHPFDLGRDRPKQFRDLRLVRLVPHAGHDPVGLQKDRKGLPQPQVLR